MGEGLGELGGGGSGGGVGRNARQSCSIVYWLENVFRNSQ